MLFTPTNPYCSLDDVRRELKNSAADVPADSDVETDILKSIQYASRWVDDYLRRDFFFHDFSVTPMTYTGFDDLVLKRRLLPRYQPIISITKINLAGTDLVENTDYFVMNQSNTDEHFIEALFGDWFPTSRGHSAWPYWGSTQVVTALVYGTFGYTQQSSFPITIAGDTAGQIASLTLSGDVTAALYYWKLVSTGTSVSQLTVYSDASMTDATAVGQGSTSAGETTILLGEMYGSGITGTAIVNYTADDSDADNTLTPGAATYDSTQIPTGLPDKIRLATQMVAAALTGRNKKEIVDITGAKTTIKTSAIPKTVLDMLGRRSPILT
jgi:hypothetical protein